MKKIFFVLLSISFISTILFGCKKTEKITELVNEFREEYDKRYKLHIERRKLDIPNLIALLERFDTEIYKPTKIYELMMRVKDKIEKELNLNENQEKLLEKWKECEDNISNDIVEQAFIYGYSLAMGLKEECKKINRN